MSRDPERLPTAFLERLALLLPDEALAATLRWFERPRSCAFRFNPLRADRPPVALLADLAASGIAGIVPAPWPPGGYRVPPTARDALTHHPLAADGSLYIQNLSSQAVCTILDPQPGEEILDLAAAPGGKTIAIAGRLGPEGQIAAVEPTTPRFYRMKENLRRCGADFVRTYLADGRSIGRKTPSRFDAVLLDAPCSAESEFRAGNPDSWRHWSPARISRSAALQHALIQSGFDALKPGGRLLYSTCTFSPEENELVLDRFLKSRGTEAVLLPLDLPFDLPPSAPRLLSPVARWKQHEITTDLTHARRIAPGDGFVPFFLALIRKSG